MQVSEKSVIDFSTARSILNFHLSVFITAFLMVNFPPSGTGDMSLSVLPQHLGNWAKSGFGILSLL